MKIFLPIISFVVLYVSEFVANFFPENAYILYFMYAICVLAMLSWLFLYGKKIWILCRKTMFSNSRFGLPAVVAAMLLFVTIAYVTTDPEYDFKVDFSKSGKNSLRIESKNIIQKLAAENKKLEIIGFFENLNEKKEFEILLSRYLTDGLSAEVNYFHPHRSPIKAKFYAVKDPNTVIVKYGQTTAQIVDVDERKLTNTILKVSQQKVKTIYFTAGHGELSTADKDVTGLSILKNHLSKNIYQVKELNLIAGGRVPDTADIVVVAGPEFDFHQKSIKALKDYIIEGGSVLLLTEALRPIENIKAFAKYFGLEIQDDLVILNQDDPRASMFGQNNALVDSFNKFHPISANFIDAKNSAVLLPNSRSLLSSEDSLNGFKAEFLGQTSKSNIRVVGVLEQKNLKKLKDSQFKFEPATILASSSRISDEKLSKLVVSGSVQFINNQNFIRPENRKLFMSILHYFSHENDSVEISPIETANKDIDLKTVESQIALNFISFILPLLFLVLALHRWLRGGNI